MSSGRRRKLLTIKNRVETSDGQGGVSVEYRAAGKIWAEFLVGTANEELVSSGLQHVVNHRLVTRYSRLIKPDTRLEMTDYDVDGNAVVRTLEVDGFIDPGERRINLEISAVENKS